MQRLQRQQVGGDVFAHGGVGAAAGFDGEDAGRGQGEVAGQELGVFAGVGEEGLGCCFGGGRGGVWERGWGRAIPGEDVVGYGRDAVFVAQLEAELEHEGGFAGADGSVGCQ